MTPSPSVALVTGASRGIGARIATRLAQAGHAVLVNYASRADEANAVVQAIEAAGGRALAVRGDVSRAADVDALFDAAHDTYGRLDILVNNAGVISTQPVAQYTDEQYARIFDINTRGTFNTLRAAATRLADGGRVINFSTTALALALPGYAIYNASKAAVEAFTQVYAKEMRGRNITVNAVAPGPVATELFLQGKTAEQVAHFTKLPPLERLGQPDDIAEVVAFLASPASGWINGQVIRANGGVA
ncbi:SDR family oxidoreductase [Bordetella genomosp. 1]|uniref:3-ketoacyl-ACP reductase n=1 Tax=Bordetella genomosp. 1 TaxID=1395607 RepID=A0ABX4F4C2_9BORD|nr:SDR family oxidoreductase [Bordetella genomosp. 1]OZI68261.1 3-ketoacyl-ACP reductase [Bordetella genomosp. 1]